MVHVVGGRIRDELLGRHKADTDLVVSSGALDSAFEIARLTGGRSVVLDAERDVARVVWPGQDASLDIASWAADSLDADLRLRDFTVNAMACPLRSDPLRDPIVDPLGGRGDLAARQLRMVSPRAFERDPLRLLRGVRLAVELDFRLETETEVAMHRLGHLAAQPAAERVRDELFRIIAHPDSPRGVALLDQLGISTALGLPSSGRHTWNGLAGLRAVLARGEGSASVDTSARGDATSYTQGSGRETGDAASPTDHDGSGLWQVLGGLTHLVRSHLAGRVAAARTVGGLLALAALADDLPPPTGDLLSDTFRLSRAERRRLTAIEAARGVWPEVVASGGTRLSVYRMFRVGGAGGVDAVLLEIALSSIRPGGGSTVETAAEAALRTWFLDRTLVQPPPVVDGTDLIQTLGIPPGRRAGLVLEAVREAQIEGRVVDRASALAVASIANARLSKAP